MRIEPGQALLHYRLISKLGEGGMGVVWRGTDTTLERDVALKFLPENFAADPDRFARFEREAKVLASLNHPGIAAIYGLHEHAGTHFIAMELVEGNDLADRLAQGPVPVEEAIAIAGQVAAALEAAHGGGVVHRDLKPANIRLTAKGKPKVLDFGLAKGTLETGAEARGDPAASPTEALHTLSNVILGTAAYMSPEQAQGQAVDIRSDIWSFGCVVFEMLTGRRAFPADSASASIGAVLHTEPEWDQLPAATPISVRRLLQRCLTKDRDLRLQHIGDARLELQHPLEQEPSAPAPPAAAFSFKSPTGWVVAGVSLLLAAIGWLGRPDPKIPPERRLSVNTPAGSYLNTGVLSPDGRRIAFTGGGGLWVRDLDRLDFRKLVAAPEAANPFWSPDGSWIAYTVRNRILKLAAGGGQPTTVGALAGEIVPGIGGGFWNGDDRLMMSSGFGGVLAVPAGGGAAEVVVPATETEHFHGLTGLPGTRVLLVTVDPDDGPDRIDLWVDGARRPLIDGPAAKPKWWNDGFVLFERRDSIWALPFDPVNLVTMGEPFVLIPRGSGASAANDGSYLYLDPGDREHQLVWVDRAGSLGETLATSSSILRYPVVSRAGARAAYEVAGNNTRRVWWWDPARGVPAPLDEKPGHEDRPAWSPDGKQIYYSTPNLSTEDTEDFEIRARELRSGTTTIVQANGHSPAVSPDGRYLVFGRDSRGLFSSLLLYMPLVPAPGEAILFAESTGTFGSQRVSPDGRHIAYFHSPTGFTAMEVYVDRFPESEGRFLVSDGGLTFAQDSLRWSPDGSRLYYAVPSTGSMMEVEISETASEDLIVSEPHVLFAVLGSELDLSAGFALSPDGERFLMVRSSVPAGGDAGGFVLVEGTPGAR